MQAFEYASPNSKEQVAALLGTSWEQGAILAGGTDLLALMKDDVVTPKRLVNVKGIEALRGTSYQPGNGLRIGALTTLAELIESKDLAQYPMLLEAVNEAASPQIRNLATIGGNICQRPRCWYFRSGLGLMPKTKDGKSMVVAGDNRYAAILGTQTGAYFVSPSTIAPALIAYGAKLRIYSAKAAGSGVRELPLSRFFITPKSAERARARSQARRDGNRADCSSSAAEPEDRLLRSSPEGGIRLAARHGGCRASDERQHGEERAHRHGTRCPDSVGFRRSRRGADRKDDHA